MNDSKTEYSLKRISYSESFFLLISIFLVPLFIYYSWICVEFNNGKFSLPSKANISGILNWMKNHVFVYLYVYALPDRYSTILYVSWLLFQAVLFKILPGPEAFGVANGKGVKVKYRFNGQLAFFTTNIIVFLLNYLNIFKLSSLYENFPRLFTMANITTVLVIALINAHSYIFRYGDTITDSFIYDFFMGRVLNPCATAGFDIKFFFELRPGIMMWWFTTAGIAFKMYEEKGSVSTPMLLICFFHLCFVNACYKGEQCVINSFDIIRERFGWMLLMLDIVLVPFVFPLQAYYIYSANVSSHSLIYTTLVTALHCVGYYIFDTANSQKDYFREGDSDIKKGFPRLPWDKLENPATMETASGKKLLIDGWWKYARHMNYTGDLMMAVAWGLICGTSSYFPFVYLTYLGPLLFHRERRDNQNCKIKYGKDWDEYCSIVKYRMIPYIY